MSLRITMVLFLLVLAVAATFIVMKYPDYARGEYEAFLTRLEQSRNQCPHGYTCTPAE